MAVKINIKGNNESNEYKDAVLLKEIFQKEFEKKNCNGEILIISNATLFGQEVKDVDLIIIGNFENFECSLNTKAKYYDQQFKYEQRVVSVKNFCFTIETKKHRAEDVQLNGLQMFVKYNNKFHDVTTQSEKQKYSLYNYFKDRLKRSPFICNFIWFRNIDWESLKELIGGGKEAQINHNFLPNLFDVKYLLERACVQLIPYSSANQGQNRNANFAYFRSFGRQNNIDFEEMNEIFELFNRIKSGIGQLTRKKIEQITKKLLDEQQYAQAIGNKLIVISGRAGTGKTIKLLRIAHDLAISEGARCLILTYNLALVSDIRRLIALAEIPDDIDTYTVNISSLHKYFYELLIGFGILKTKYSPDYLSKYKEYMDEMLLYIRNGLVNEKDIQKLMIDKKEKVAWDYILIDEAQDWSEIEKSVLFEIFGKEKIIVADGRDQLIRTQQKCNWIKEMKKDIDYKITYENKCLRQEVNLVSFINSYAKKIGINWELESKQELIGGKIIISSKGYTKKLHESEVKRCKEFGNKEYEMIFLVPPKLVDITQSTNSYGDIVQDRSFGLKTDFEKMGIRIWDSTSKDLRNEYPIDLSQHRLLQYESCRGLEGWTVVCLELDEFVRYKMETFKEEEFEQLSLESFEEKRDKFVYLWSLIPLTRAIDTLIITIKNKQSTIGRALKEIYNQNPDFIEWIE